MKALQHSTQGLIDPRQVRDMRTSMMQALNATGQFSVQSLKAKSATQAFTESLIRQDASFGKAYRARKSFNEVLREQYKLQRMTTVQWTRNASGGIGADVIVPRGVPATVGRLTGSLKENAGALRRGRTDAAGFSQAMDVMRMRMALGNAVLKSGAQNMIKWGKNTQWAGRQLMVGFTVPFAAFAAVAGAASYKVDQELTRIAKVYDTTTRVVGNNQRQMMQREQELGAMRTQSLNLAIETARRYGTAVDDTLKVEAELAATGLNGQNLMNATAEVQRIATLGEMEYGKAVEMTIALQAAFGLSIEEVTDKMNFMNSIENATSLSLQDFADATPRAATAMSQLGVSVEEMGILLVAMKERGVNAAQGANALKSATVQLLRPSKEAVERVRGLSNGMLNLGEIGRESGGNLFKALDIVGNKIEGLSDIKKQQIIANMFGTYQFNRLNAALVGISERTGQVERGFEVMGQSTTEWAQTASREINAIMTSPSGRFKAAVQTIKGELAKLGEPFLKFATMVIGGVTAILRFFNNLPGAVKIGVMAFFGLMAIAGPLIMLTGLFANMIGQVLNLGANLGQLAVRMRLVTAEQQVEKMLAQQTSAMWQNQGLAAQALSAQLKMLVAGLSQVTAAQIAASRAAGMPIAPIGATRIPPPSATGVVTGSSNVATRRTQYKVDNKFASPQDPRVLAALASADAHSKAIADSSAKTSRNWSSIGNKAAGLAGAAGMIGLLAGGSSEMVQNISMGLLLAAMIGPTIASGIRKAKISQAIAGAVGAGGRTGARGMMGSLSTIARSFVGLGGVGILLAGIAGTWFAIRKSMQRTREEQEKINKSAKDWASVLGFVYQEQAKLQDGSGNAKDSMETMSSKLQKANGPLVARLQLAKQTGDEERLMNMAIMEGVKARRHGATAAQAEQAVQLALWSAGIKDMERLDEIMKGLKFKIDFTSETSMMEAEIGDMTDRFTRIANNKVKQGKWEGFGRVFSGRQELNAGAKEMAEGLSDDFWNTFQQKDQQGRRQFFTTFTEQIAAEQDRAFSKLSDETKSILSKYGLDSFSEITQAWADKDSMSVPKFDAKYGAGAEIGLQRISGDDLKTIKLYAEAETALAQKIAYANGVRGKELKQYNTLKSLGTSLSMANLTIADSQEHYRMALNASQAAGEKMTGTDKLRLLNSWRMAAGLKAATSIEQGFTEAVGKGTGALAENADAMAENYYEASEFAGAYAEATKAAMSGGRDYAMDYAEELRSKYDDGLLEAITEGGRAKEDALDDAAKAQDRKFDQRGKDLDRGWKDRMDKFDDGWKDRIKTEKDGYEARIDAIKDSLDAEEKANDARERMFEAEKTRIERLASIANKRIDFNLALNSGNLDEAAKVFSDMGAEQDQFALDDQIARNEVGQEAKREKGESAIEKLEKERDARLESLEDIEKAEREALEDKKQREKDALDAEKERYQDGIEAQKKAISERTKADEAAKRAELDRAKRTLDLTLMQIKASTPRNQAEYDEQIKQIEEAYAAYGVRLTDKGNEWSGVIGSGLTANIKSAATSLQNEINWRQLAAQITSQFTEGAFGLSQDQFAKWISTGELPEGGMQVQSPTPPSRINSAAAAAEKAGRATRHKGGKVNKSAGSRAGITASASRYPSEVDTRLRVGEYVIKKSSVNKYGTGFMEAVNQGKIDPTETHHKGGLVGGQKMGMVGALAGGLIGGIKNAILGAAAGAAQRAMSAGIPLPAAPKRATAPAPTAPISAQAILAALRQHESGGNYKAQSRISSASGAYQYINSTWGGYGGYARASDAPANVQDERAMKDLMAAYTRLGDWRKAVANHFYPAWANDPTKWNQSPSPGNPTVNDYVNSIMSKAGVSAGGGSMGSFQGVALMPGGGSSGMPFGPVTGLPDLKSPDRDGTWRNAGGWKTNMDPNVVRQVAGILAAIPGGQIITSAFRSQAAQMAVNPGVPNSAHTRGKAVDIAASSRQNGGTAQDEAMGDMIAQAFKSMPGVKSVLWKTMQGGNHHNHVHAEFRHKGGPIESSMVKGLRNGGYTLNEGFAKLHPNEAVLTAPLTAQLESGIAKIDQGMNNEYNVKVDLRGAFIREDIDIEKAINFALDKRESKLGRGRSIK